MKAFTLVSGGLDSILAARLVKELGIEIIPLLFKIPFCHRVKEKEAERKKKWFKEVLGLEPLSVDICNEFLGLLNKPKHGFGRNMNPCIDCKILMLRKSKDLMGKSGVSFVVTGEVLGQRPMSQNKAALLIIEKESGLEGLLLRPLSAGLLLPTTVEEKGWIKRRDLLKISGRSRKPQMGLAEKFKIREYPNAAGGCLLTEPQFSRRLKDVMQFDKASIENIELLKVGRYFRLSDTARLVVGRNEKENEALLALAQQGDYLFMPGPDIAGPSAVGRGIFGQEEINLSGAIISRYCDLKIGTATIFVEKRGENKNGRCPYFVAGPISEQQLSKLRV